MAEWARARARPQDRGEGGGTRGPVVCWDQFAADVAKRLGARLAPGSET
jgi:hypothetical protein